MYNNLPEIKKVIEQLERSYDLILVNLDPTKEESFSINLNHMNSIQDRIEELLHEVQIIKLLTQTKIKN